MTIFKSNRSLVSAFKAQHTHLSFKKLTDYSGVGKMYCTDTRVAFYDWIDYLVSNGDISDRLANSCNLSA
jgi:hypothetical protein